MRFGSETVTFDLTELSQLRSHFTRSWSASFPLPGVGGGGLPAIFLCPVSPWDLGPPSVGTIQALVSISTYNTGAQAGGLADSQGFLTVLQILKFIPNVAFTQLL